jgi:hypothetical protein
MQPDISGDAPAGSSPDLCTDLLDGSHQRITEKHDPGDGKTELRTSLAVGGYAARVIIGCARDETWAKSAGYALADAPNTPSSMAAIRAILGLLQNGQLLTPYGSPGM